MTRYWYDTEFLEDGHTIELISIGVVASDGREYHAVVGDGDFDRVLLSPWLLANVVPHLPLKSGWLLTEYLDAVSGRTLDEVRVLVSLNERHPLVKPRALIAAEVRDFLLAGDGNVELWADYGAYNHVVLCQLWGRMIDLPEGVPMFTRDVQQEAARLGLTDQLPAQETDEHHALADAHACRERWLWLRRQESLSALRKVELNIEERRR